MASIGKIDVHHHFVPPKFNDAVKRHGNPEWPDPTWRVEDSQALLQNRGISSAILSVTSPGVDVVSDLETQVLIARDANTTGAATRDAHPSQFGFFATIPNPVKFLDGAIAEVQHALDVLHADGVTLLSSYSGTYLGHECLTPLWTELNRRKAVVFIHPTSPPAQHYKQVSEILLTPILDFTFETTKTAVDLICSGTTMRNPQIKMILSHAGGNLPWIWHRPAVVLSCAKLVNITVEQFREEASNFYYDTALTGWSPDLELLFKFAKKGHVLYGSDFPYAHLEAVNLMTDGLDEFLLTTDDETRRDVSRRNALSLFPRFTCRTRTN